MSDITSLKEKYKNSIDIILSTKHYYNETNIKEIEDSNYPRNICRAGISTIFINHDGNIYPCVECAGEKQFIIGSIVNNRLIDLWNSSAWYLYRGGWNVEDITECSSCERLKKCNLISCRIYPVMQGRSFFDNPTNCKNML